jgi:hypothetical protein
LFTFLTIFIPLLQLFVGRNLTIMQAALQEIFRALARDPAVSARIAGHLSAAEQRTLAAAFA